MGTGILSGIARGRVDRWLAEHVPGAVPPFDYRAFAGGRSNLTYAVTDREARRFVLRRPPLGHVLASAHDMRREHRTISALAPTVVAVAQPLAFCADPAVNDAPFYVMDFVEGVVIRNEEDADRYLDEAARGEASRSLVDVLAHLHALDPGAVGLGDLGRGDGYVARQLRRWHGQFEQSKVEDIPALDEVHQRLASRVPPQRRTSVVHGDYRLENCILNPDGTVRAVIDWELCTLGDPLADLGWFAAYWVESGETGAHPPGGVAAMPAGFLDRHALVARYVERTSADLEDFDFYLAFAYWKRACVAAGVSARYRAGVMADEAMVAHAETFSEQVQRLVDQARAVCDRWLDS